MSSNLSATHSDYVNWLRALKSRFASVQLKAAVSVNTALLQFYWELGQDIVAKQQHQAWGDGFLAQLSRDLMAEFPSVKGFSLRNLKYIRQWFLFWSTQNIGQQAVAQLHSIPWGHNLAIISKCKSQQEALYYVQNTLSYGWSRSVLVHQIESALWQREGQALNNFSQTLPAVQSELAQQTLKDPYVFDFLSLSKEHTERDQPTIGLLLCKSKDKLVAEYALSDIHKPIGIAEYQLLRKLPEALSSKLPSIEQIEAELSADLEVKDDQ